MSPKKNEAVYINLKVNSQMQDRDVIFQVKPHRNLKSLMSTYCKMKTLDIKSTVFLFDGRKLNPLMTPKELGMEDGDEIDAVGWAERWWFEV